MISCKLEGGKCRFISAHRVSYCMEHKIRLNDIAGMDASHLCHNSLCVTASHITLETHSINNNRITRLYRNKCSGHAPFGSYCDK